jgi:hypothetical protein
MRTKHAVAIEQRALTVLSRKRMSGDWLKCSVRTAIRAIKQAEEEVEYELRLLAGEIGLSELVTGSPEQYSARALELAARPALRSRLAENRTCSLLFDTQRFCRRGSSLHAHVAASAGRLACGAGAAGVTGA